MLLGMFAILPLNTKLYPTANAANVVELSASDGATVCPTDLAGFGVSAVTWNATSSTCAVTAKNNTSPTVCIASTTSGCAAASIDELIIDSGVTVVLSSGNGSNTAAILCVYSSLVNYGNITGGICNYGTITNHGTIDIAVGNSFENNPDTGFGVIENAAGGDIINNYIFEDTGTIVNNGTINNIGVFENDNQYNGTFTNNGEFIGSAPCLSNDGCYTFIGTYNVGPNQTTIDTGTGVSLTIMGASGTNVLIISQNQTTAAPLGLGSLNVSSSTFYDVLVNGISTGTAQICITNEYITASATGGMQYWNGTNWVLAGNQTVSGSSPSMTICGDVPVWALNGTPIATGIPETNSGTSALTITSQDTSGNTVNGFYTVLNQSGIITATGMTPATFTLNDNQVYTVQVDNYSSCYFDYWADTGSTLYYRVISISTNTSLTAVIACPAASTSTTSSDSSSSLSITTTGPTDSSTTASSSSSTSSGSSSVPSSSLSTTSASTSLSGTTSSSLHTTSTTSVGGMKIGIFEMSIYEELGVAAVIIAAVGLSALFLRRH